MKKQKLILATFILCSLLLLIFLFVSMDNSEHTAISESSLTDIEVSEESSSIIEQSESLEAELTNMKLYEMAESSAESEATSNIDIPVSSSTEDSLEKKSPSPERITYMPDFYYEPLSNEIIDRINGISYKTDCPLPYENLRYVHVLHVNFNNEIVDGELICNEDIAQDLIEIFYSLYEQRYQIEKIKLVDDYNADDKLSMIDNNTSCFNYRTVEGTTSISKHGLGLAIDINPFYNPYITKNNDGTVYISPPGSESYADRTKDFSHKITKDDLCYKLFTEHGFLWGGNWKYTKDYQHFYKEP